MIVDTIYIKDGEKLQVTCKLISNKDDIITLEPLTVVLEDIASYVSDLPIDDRSTPEPPVITTDVPMLDDLTKIEMELWKSVYVDAYGGVHTMMRQTSNTVPDDDIAAACLADANRAIVKFRESFGISIEPIETPE